MPRNSGAMSKRNPDPVVDRTGRIATLAFAVVVLIGIVALAALSFVRQNAPAAVATASPQPTVSERPTPAETPGTHFPSQGHPGHDKTDPSQVAGFVYNSDPPTSGMHLEHFSDALINAKPLPKWLQVHLLEHGNVLLQYNCNCPDIVAALTQIASEYDNRQLAAGQTTFTPDDVSRIEEAGTGVIVAPYPGMKHKIALTAWTRLESLDSIDQSKIGGFINAYLTNEANATQ